MPSRALEESICCSDDPDCLTAFKEAMFYRLMVRVDDDDRLDARAAFWCLQLVTPRADVIKAMLYDIIDRLAKTGLIACYTVADKPYLDIINWQKHQWLRCTKKKYSALPGESLLRTASHAGAKSQYENEFESEKEDDVRRSILPILEQMAAHCQKRKNRVSAQRFVYFYAPKVWLVSALPMAEWRVAIRRWEERSTSCGSAAARASPRKSCCLSTTKNYDSEDCI
ncbi:hypothetical protein DSECCO2_625610 [anaerobic digester metagenome]